MDLGFLSFLAEPWFVIPWYAVGLLGMAWVIRDLQAVNTPLKTAMKWGWPIIVLFFSVIGIALYLATARAPGIADTGDPDAKKQKHHAYEENMLRRVNGAVIHCVAGDGIGIMTGMVIARAVGMSFWQEFWFEYAVGFACGWFVFQLKSMSMMVDSTGKALLLAFRAEFFSMLTVMAGMGAVMTFVTPLAITAQPGPLTFAFWGFGALGLMVGYVFTFPMNWMMVKLGWKHGMGGMEAAKKREVERPGAKRGLLAAMVALGAVALAIPAWLTEVREGRPLEAGAGGASGPVGTLAAGLRASLDDALAQYRDGNHSRAAHAIDASLRAAEVGAQAAPDAGFEEAVEEIRDARRELHDGAERAALGSLRDARGAVEVGGTPAQTPPDLDRYVGVTVVNASGVVIGEVTGRSGDAMELALGGARDVFGFLDLSSRQHVTVPASELLFGPSRFIGLSLVALPTLGTPPVQASR